MKSLKRLFNRRRYQRCREMFVRPLATHLKTALALRLPTTVEFRDGGRLRLPSAYRCRSMFAWLLERSDDPSPVRLVDGLVEFQYRGRRMALRPTYADFFIFQEVVVCDDYGLANPPKPLGTVVDLGGNIGLFAMQAAPLADRVISVEPMNENLAMARRTLAAAGVADRVTLRKAAVAAESGKTLRIYFSQQNDGGHSAFQEQAARWGNRGTFEEATTINLVDLFEQEKIDRCGLLKCDVEGSEYELIDATPVELLARIDRIDMEVHPNVVDYDQRRFTALCDKLRAAGFEITHTPLRRRWGLRATGIILKAVNTAAANTVAQAA